MTALHTLGILSISFMRNAFPTVPTYAEHLLAAFPPLCGPTQPKHPNWVEVWCLWRPGHLALTQPGGVLGHCPVDKQMILPLSANQMGWRIAAECCCSHAV